MSDGNSIQNQSVIVVKQTIESWNYIQPYTIIYSQVTGLSYNSSKGLNVMFGFLKWFDS